MTNKEVSPIIDENEVDEFFDDYCRATGKLRSRGRREALDKRIEDAALGVEEKIEVVKMLSPHGSPTGFRTELRMERLICSIGHENLSWFKFAIDYDGDYKDMEEYVFHDIDDEDSQGEIVDHLKSAKSDDEVGTKVLTDVDDTLYANLVDNRYPKKTFYPGVLDLYEALKREPFPLVWEPSGINRIPITTLSARPNPVAGTLEENSIESLVEHTKGRLCPTGLSGKVVSSAIGTLETLGRKASLQFAEDFDRLEQEIGIVKFNNFKRYAKIYPEYRYVFFGDSGQADALTADLMLEGSDRGVIATFIHDLRQSKTDRKAASPTFRKVLKVAQDRMIVFRNHIDAANQAFERFGGDLLSASALAKVTKAALDEFCEIKWEDESARQMLVEQYREDAQRTVKLLESHHEDVKVVRKSLNRL